MQGAVSGAISGRQRPEIDASLVEKRWCCAGQVGSVASLACWLGANSENDVDRGRVAAVPDFAQQAVRDAKSDRCADGRCCNSCRMR